MYVLAFGDQKQTIATISIRNEEKRVNRRFMDTYGELVAECQILLAVALGHFNGIVDIVNGHAVVGNVLHQARSAAALEIGRERRGSPRPDFDTRTILHNC